MRPLVADMLGAYDQGALSWDCVQKAPSVRLAVHAGQAALLPVAEHAGQTTTLQAPAQLSTTFLGGWALQVCVRC